MAVLNLTRGVPHPFQSKFHCAWKCSLGIFVILAALSPVSGKAQTTSREYQLKAAFLYNFAQFTDWPTNAFADTNSPIVIGVLGTDPFGRVLDETIRGESVKGRSLIIQRFKHVEEIKACHVLFISQSEANRMNRILPAVKNRSILTASDLDGFAQKGGIIEFSTEHNKIKLTICVDVAKAVGITMSSKLLRLADIVPLERN
jgi:hypothetical protein